MTAYRATLDIPRALAQFVSKLLAAERRAAAPRAAAGRFPAAASGPVTPRRVGDERRATSIDGISRGFFHLITGNSGIGRPVSIEIIFGR